MQEFFFDRKSQEKCVLLATPVQDHRIQTQVLKEKVNLLEDKMEIIQQQQERVCFDESSSAHMLLQKVIKCISKKQPEA